MDLIISRIYMLVIKPYSVLSRCNVVAGNDYVPDSAKWNELSETQRQAIWEINYYGYSYPGLESENYYIATQIMIFIHREFIIYPRQRSML